MAKPNLTCNEIGGRDRDAQSECNSHLIGSEPTSGDSQVEELTTTGRAAVALLSVVCRNLKQIGQSAQSHGLPVALIVEPLGQTSAFLSLPSEMRTLVSRLLERSPGIRE